MVVPLDKSPIGGSRYQMLSSPPVGKHIDKSLGNDHINGLKYVSFIRSLPDGKLKKDNNGNRASPASAKKKVSPVRYGSKGSNHSRSENISPNFTKKVHNPMQLVSKVKAKNEETHKKKLKAIEACMFHSKQHERELKRIEGDIIQRGKMLKKIMKDYENESYERKRSEEERILIASREEEAIKQRSAKEDSKLTKDRIHRNIDMLQQSKEIDNKGADAINGIEFRYENVAEAINLKRLQVQQLVKEFETKVKEKEDEEFRLKQEFANLTLALNMEAQKRRLASSKTEILNKKVDQKDKSDNLKREESLKDKLKYHQDKAKHGELGVRKLSLDKQKVFGTLYQKEREDGRRLKDVKVKLQDNAASRKQVLVKSELAEMERLGMQSMEKVMSVNANRKVIQDMLIEERKQKNDLSLNQWRRRNFAVNHASKKVELDDNIKHFQKILSKQEDTENSLYNQVKKVEYDRKKQEEIVELMKQELLSLQKHNKALLLETEKHCQRKENEIQQRLMKEEAQLGRALSEREEKIQSLNKCRNMLTEDRHMLGEEKKVRDRLIRIEEKSGLIRHEESMQKSF